MTKTSIAAVKAVRRANLAALLDKFGKTELSRITGINADYLFQMGKGEGKSARTVSDPKAAQIEKKLSMPPGSMDTIFDDTPLPVAGFATAQDYTRLQLLEGGAGMGDGVVNEDYPEVIREVEISNTELRKKLGFLPAPGRIQLITGRGPSMYPDIEDGEVVAVDTQINFFDGDDFYLININGMTQIKQLQMRPDGLHVVSSNPRFHPYRVENPDEIAIGGKAILGLRVHRLGV